jgi:hypothetical protein
MSTKRLFTKAQLDAHGAVHRMLAWLPPGASQDEIISALRHVADKLQEKATRLENKLRKLATP